MCDVLGGFGGVLHESWSRGCMLLTLISTPWGERLMHDDLSDAWH